MNHHTHAAYIAAEQAFINAQQGLAVAPTCFYAQAYYNATKACWDIIRNAESPEDKAFNDAAIY